MSDGKVKVTEPLALVLEHAEDEGLWFAAATAAEAYLQQELRRLHKAVEAQWRSGWRGTEMSGDRGLRERALEVADLLVRDVPDDEDIPEEAALLRGLVVENEQLATALRNLMDVYYRDLDDPEWSEARALVGSDGNTE